ncbi:hypothetical protein G3M48_002217 [Beauveria asiatica]|uniref:F-box domain-containing protein n=1 Tax=Beauveria asiatica TaxID=1069075 RepID=A0AAW0RXU1_9HYPO
MDSTTALLGARCTQPNVYERGQSISTSSNICHFLNLPHEIVLEIIDHLQQDSKAVLYLTCSPLRNIIYHGYQLRTELRFWSDRKMAIRFLNCMGKERLDVWVCNYCLRFHQNCADSVPSAGAEHICEYGTGILPNLIYGLSRTCCHMLFVAADIGPWTFIKARQLQELPRELCLVHVVCTCRTEIRIDQYGTTVRTQTWEDFGSEFSSLSTIVRYDYRACEGPERVRDLYESTMDDLDSFYTTQSAAWPGHGAEPQNESRGAGNQEMPRRHGRSDETERVMEVRWARLKGWIKMLLGFPNWFSVRREAGTATSRPWTPHPAAPLQPLNLRPVRGAHQV